MHDESKIIGGMPQTESGRAGCRKRQDKWDIALSTVRGEKGIEEGSTSIQATCTESVQKGMLFDVRNISRASRSRSRSPVRVPEPGSCIVAQVPGNWWYGICLQDAAENGTTFVSHRQQRESRGYPKSDGAQHDPASLSVQDEVLTRLTDSK